MQDIAALVRASVDRSAVRSGACRFPVVRSGLRLADLKAPQTVTLRLTNVKIPAAVAGAIEQDAAQTHASKTQVVIALLNEDLRRAAARLGTTP